MAPRTGSEVVQQVLFPVTETREWRRRERGWGWADGISASRWLILSLWREAEQSRAERKIQGEWERVQNEEEGCGLVSREGE